MRDRRIPGRTSAARLKSRIPHLEPRIPHPEPRMFPDTESTQRLLAQAGDGEEAAVNELIERHRESLRRMVAGRMDRKMAQRVDASDIVQETLVEAHRRLQEYIADGTMPFHLWLRHIARDRMIDAHRRHRAQRRDVGREQAMYAPGTADRSSLDLAAQLCDMELTPAAQALKQELERRFWAAIDELDEQDREIVLMRHQEQLGNSEVAEILGLSQPAAGMRYLRAIRRLRAVLGESPSGGDASGPAPQKPGQSPSENSD